MLGRSDRGEGRQRILQRSDAIVDSTPVEGNLVKIKKPKFITLVGKPANQTPIKIIRADEEKESQVSHPMIRRMRRSEVNPVMRLTFPAGSDEAAVAEALKLYGLSGYTISNETGVYTATRADVKSISKDSTMQIMLSDDGLLATVARQDTSLPQATEKAALSMVRVEFDSTKFTLEEVQRWATEKCVDGAVEEPQNPGQCYVVRRSEVSENEETRRMVLEDGVEAVIVRADTYNVPDGFITAVNECAYGNWGWGQLDFAAALADQAFSESMRTSIRMLEDVLRNIVIYSALPLDVRKELAVRALGQFGEYVTSVMDSLPRQLLVSVVRSANPQTEKSMTQANAGGAPTNPAEKKEDATPLTRADVQTMIAEAVTAALAATKTTPAPVDTTRNDTTTAPATTAAPAQASLTREDIKAALKEIVDPLAERMKAMEGTTLLRAAPNDPVTTKAEPGEKDVFRGAIFGNRKAAAK